MANDPNLPPGAIIPTGGAPGGYVTNPGTPAPAAQNTNPPQDGGDPSSSQASQPQSSGFQPTGTQGSPPSTNLEPGSTGPNVQQLQSWLTQMGYLQPGQLGTGAGTYGPTTTAAVAKMQQDLGVNAGSASGDYGPQTQSAIASKYNNVFSANQGTTTPETQSEASTIIAGQTQPSTDPVYNSFLTAMQPALSALTQVMSNINNPAVVGTSLQTEYNNLSSQYNLPQMNSQLLNMQNVMNGTQQDIENEITTAGGTATASQVAALTASRNNVILTQYNALNTTYQAAVTNVQNMMQYAGQDQQTALSQQSATAGIAESLASIEGQVGNMGVTMGENATSSYQSTLKSLGYNYTAFASSVPANVQPYAEQLLGLAPGTLSNPTELAALTTASQTQIADMYKAYSLGLPAPYPTGGTTTPDTSGEVTTGPQGQTLPSTVVGGIDFGPNSGAGAYASNVYNEVTGVGSIYNGIVQDFGSANPTGAQLQAHIQAVAPSSGITGSMIATVAAQWGISPAVLAATAQNETSYGTAGEALNGTKNPGGVMDPTTGTYATYATWEGGLNAMAQQLSRRQVANSGISDPASSMAAKISQQSPQFQQWTNGLNNFDGVPYFTATDLTGETAGEKAQIKNAAIAVGLKNLSPKDADALSSISSAQDDLNSFGTFIATGAGGGTPLLPKNAQGQPQQYGDVTLNEYLATNNQLAAFDSWDASVIPVLSALKGSGSGGGGSSRLFGTVSDLIPKDTDTLPEAMQKINNIQQILANGAKGILGNNAPLVLPSPPALFGSQGMMVLQSDGTYSLVGN